MKYVGSVLTLLHNVHKTAIYGTIIQLSIFVNEASSLQHAVMGRLTFCFPGLCNVGFVQELHELYDPVIHQRWDTFFHLLPFQMENPYTFNSHSCKISLSGKVNV